MDVLCSLLSTFLPPFAMEGEFFVLHTHTLHCMFQVYLVVVLCMFIPHCLFQRESKVMEAKKAAGRGKKKKARKRNKRKNAKAKAQDEAVAAAAEVSEAEDSVTEVEAPPAAPEAAVAAEIEVGEADSWSCAACTYRNRVVKRCALCDKPRSPTATEAAAASAAGAEAAAAAAAATAVPVDPVLLERQRMQFFFDRTADGRMYTISLLVVVFA
jgi:hypothetical protein